MAIVLNIDAIYRHRLRRDLANGAAILLRPFSVNTLISLPSHLCKKMTPTPLSQPAIYCPSCRDPIYRARPAIYCPFYFPITKLFRRAVNFRPALQPCESLPQLNHTAYRPRDQSAYPSVLAASSAATLYLDFADSVPQPLLVMPH